MSAVRMVLEGSGEKSAREDEQNTYTWLGPLGTRKAVQATRAATTTKTARMGKSGGGMWWREAKGIFFTLFVILCFMLFHPAFTCPSHRTVIAPASIVMMILASVHLILAVVRAIEAFIMHPDAKFGEQPNPSKYYEDFTHPVQIVKTCTFVAQALVGDGIMIWRCYVIYSHRKVVLMVGLLPLILNTAVAGVAIKDYAKEDQAFFDIPGRWLPIFLALTLAINTLCSAAIVFKIYTTASKSRVIRKFHPIISATIESGFLYVSEIVALIITFTLKTPAVYIVLEIFVPVVGIVFTLMMLQIYLHLSRSARTTPNNLFEQTNTLPTLGTLPRWRQYMTSLTERQQQEYSDSRLTQPARIYSTNQASVSSDIDIQVKGKTV
ncbi:hypothetical protein AGABI2DRAFT_177409 [Agaricus bisporus var. bisporus H97]|uniref:hypothetical protein n=1 Tax=Agaricus bisporus var. bisporus (strain H97 / ATCC MYA-4626 / FGSC 10389) TaxID=936046 RepID=UPI00029F7B07|nr:hypothetical protein AGABI2DRAFT_177409 [Agaricus bisporus var. bisporus H97]EKV49400.1 hypothetical protein AGABI2DRAFT_177409 [Agaricus bisporus var. bisporus H97]